MHPLEAEFPYAHDDENQIQYRTFTEYLKLGVGRSVHALHLMFERVKDLPGVFHPGADEKLLAAWNITYSWDDRAANWDQQNLNMKEKWLSKQKDENKLERVIGLVESHSKIVAAIKVSDLNSLSGARLVKLQSVIDKELRDEFDDLPVQKTETIRKVISTEDAACMESSELLEIARQLLEKTRKKD